MNTRMSSLEQPLRSSEPEQDRAFRYDSKERAVLVPAQTARKEK